MVSKGNEIDEIEDRNQDGDDRIDGRDRVKQAEFDDDLEERRKDRVFLNWFSNAQIEHDIDEDAISEDDEGFSKRYLAAID